MQNDGRHYDIDDFYIAYIMFKPNKWIHVNPHAVLEYFMQTLR